MLDVKQIVVTCDECSKKVYMRLDWSEFRLPKDWRYRTKSFDCDNSPSNIQIVCNDCFEKSLWK